MIDEQRLRAAAAKADRAIQDSLPAPGSCDHAFPPAFEEQLRRLGRRARHPWRPRLAKAACFLLTLCLAGGAWMAVDLDARAAVITWVRARYEAMVEYRFAGSAPEAQTRYAPTWLPEGFTLREENQNGSLSMTIYESEEGERLVLLSTQGADATSLFLVSEGAKVLPATVNGTAAEFYQDSEAGSANALVWTREPEGALFCLTAPLPRETLVRVAESLEEKN